MRRIEVLAGYDVPAMDIEEGPGYGDAGFQFLGQLLKRALRNATPDSIGSDKGVTIYLLKADARTSFVYAVADGNDKPVGILKVDKLEGLPTVDAVYVDKAFQQRGIGRALYAGAVEAFHKLRSSPSLSMTAVLTWRSLSKFCHVMLYSKEGKPVEFTWGSDGVPAVEGKPITSLDDDFYFLAIR